MNIMGDTTEDVDVEIAQKDNKIEFLGNKVGLPVSKFMEEKNRLGLNKMSSKRKVDRNKDRLNKSPNNHKNIINKKQ